MASVFSNKRGKRNADIACIFVHAGAGYHSYQNENIHLQACTDACKAGMAIMKNGGSSCDAVEIAIKVLEDREITNAAYGSNLAMDGVVECDAVIVDHYGRSGACGAVAQIKNPICLARLVLDHTTTQLSLRRVPPNLLVGQGATDFAASFSMPVLSHDALVSPAARDRWLKWRHDLKNVEGKARQAQPHLYDTPMESQYDFQATDQIKEQMRHVHTRAFEAGVWNEGQPLSPPASSDRLSQAGSSPLNPSRRSTPSVRGLSSANTTPDICIDPSLLPYTSSDPYGPPGHAASRNPFMNSTDTFPMPPSRQSSQHVNDGHFSASMGSPEFEMVDLATDAPMSDLYHSHHGPWTDGSSSDELSTSSDSTLQLPSLTPSPELVPSTAEQQPSGLSPPIEEFDLETRSTATAERVGHVSHEHTTPAHHMLHERNHSPPPVSPNANSRRSRPDRPSRSNPQQSLPRDDHVTDTVGVVAIDSYGNIACGASSGGIGMKHRGRIGPAALVGVGAAVIPVEHDDRNKTCVASVTSGTGEHMATTMAATVAADRIYHGVKRAKGGSMVAVEDDEALRSFVEKDFMGHPSVRNSNSAGAIGLLCVKKTKEGAYLYFAHNTDSFALASMHSEEEKPVCTMSRSAGNGVIAQGGRAIRMRHGGSSGGKRERHR